jgi:hypothetical protein
VADRSRGGIFAGILLLGLGAVLLVMQFVPQVRAMDLWSLFPLVVGVAFLAGYGYGRQYGFLIPGCILTGLGLGALVARLLPGGVLAGLDATVAGLGLGFLAIYPIDLGARGRQPGQWWPLIPGGIILVTGVAPALWRDFWQVAPAVALIVIGGVILVRALRPHDVEPPVAPTAPSPEPPAPKAEAPKQDVQETDGPE